MKYIIDSLKCLKISLLTILMILQIQQNIQTTSRCVNLMPSWFLNRLVVHNFSDAWCLKLLLQHLNLLSLFKHKYEAISAEVDLHMKWSLKRISWAKAKIRSQGVTAVNQTLLQTQRSARLTYTSFDIKYIWCQMTHMTINLWHMPIWPILVSKEASTHWSNFS